MADDSDVLLKFIEQQWAEAKQAEDQRATVTNIILVIVSVIIGFIAQKGLSLSMLPLSLLLITIGLYGTIISTKLYERHQFHRERLRGWRNRIDELHPNAKLIEIKERAISIHESKFPKLVNIRLHILWNIIHITVAMIGVVITVVILIWKK